MNAIKRNPAHVKMEIVSRYRGEKVASKYRSTMMCKCRQRCRFAKCGIVSNITYWCTAGRNSKDGNEEIGFLLLTKCRVSIYLRGIFYFDILHFLYPSQ